MSNPTSAAPDDQPGNFEPVLHAGRRSHRLAGALSLLEALVLVGFCAFYAYEMVTGATADLTRAATSGVLILVFAVFLLVLARGWFRAVDWPRTPTILWNVLLLPVAWSLHDSGRTPLGVAVAAVAVASILAALSAPPNDPIQRDGDLEADATGGGRPPSA